MSAGESKMDFLLPLLWTPPPCCAKTGIAELSGIYIHVCVYMFVPVRGPRPRPTPMYSMPVCVRMFVGKYLAHEVYTVNGDHVSPPLEPMN